MTTTTLTRHVTTDLIASQWDAVAEARLFQIQSGDDVTYHNILIPTVLELLRRSNHSDVLDVGCGVGYLSSVLAKHAEYVVGVDVSKNSIAIAKREFGDTPNITFENDRIELLATRYQGTFDVAVANMFFMDTPNLDASLSAIAQCLRSSGSLVFTIPHPCFWPRYWNYEREPWFSYSREIAVECDFRISRDPNAIGRTIHIHRPIERYISILRQCGFQIQAILEPFPDVSTMRLYPRVWDFPRYLAAQLTKI